MKSILKHLNSHHAKMMICFTESLTPRISKYLILFSFPVLLNACFFGGLFVKGGANHTPAWHPAASLVHEASYQIVCHPEDFALNYLRAKPKSIDPKGSSHFEFIAPAEYRGGCERTGQSSVLYILNLWPLTEPIDPEYAIASAVQSLEGDTMINIRVWHQIHYYGIVGRVAVMYIKGDVIKYN